MRRIVPVLAVILLLFCMAPAFAQKKSDNGTRTVEGVVSNPDDSPAAGAVVQLENTKTQQIRSFITQDDGKYHFFELSTEVDYKLKADSKGATSGSKTLSSFDGRKKAVINLKLSAK
jgi:type 1 fimbria pilin